jgi:AcrR family transcriptional regulator
MKEMEREVRKQALLDAAKDLFAQVGYDGTTIESIAHRAGMAKGSFYLHYRSKEEIFRALMEMLGDQIISEIQAIGQGTADIEERLTGIAEVILRFHAESSHPWLLIIMEKGLERHEVMEHFFKKRKQVMEGINVVISEAMKDGKIIEDDPDRLSSMFLGCINGTVVRICCFGEELEARKEAQWLTRRFLDGALVRGVGC